MSGNYLKKYEPIAGHHFDFYRSFLHKCQCKFLLNYQKFENGVANNLWLQ